LALLVHSELRVFAAAKLTGETGTGLLATTPVREPDIRRVNDDNVPHLSGRGHLFSATAEEVGRIPVESVID
jgi:hypothetical protein